MAPKYPSHPHKDYYTPAEEDLLEEVMNYVMVRYGKDPRKLQRVFGLLGWPIPEPKFSQLVSRW